MSVSEKNSKETMQIIHITSDKFQVIYTESASMFSNKINQQASNCNKSAG
jgi:hypothetical protein